MRLDVRPLRPTPARPIVLTIVAAFFVLALPNARGQERSSGPATIDVPQAASDPIPHPPAAAQTGAVAGSWGLGRSEDTGASAWTSPFARLMGRDLGQRVNGRPEILAERRPLHVLFCAWQI